MAIPAPQNALDLLEKYDKVLSCILIGNNIVNLTAATLGTVLFTKLLGPVYGPAASTVVLTIIVLIFGEITPKTLANDQAETFCMRAAPALRVCLVILTPLHLFFSLFQKALSGSSALQKRKAYRGGTDYHGGRGRKRRWVGAP